MSQIENFTVLHLTAYSLLPIETINILKQTANLKTHRNTTFASNFIDYFEYFCPLLVVYRKELRSNSWSLRVKNMANLFSFFLSIPSQMYIYSIAYLFQCIDHWNAYLPKIFNLFKNESKCFNEDVGEVLNGMLSRKTMNSFTMRCDIHQMTEEYIKLTVNYAETRNYVNKQSKKFKDATYEKHPLVKKLIVHFSEVIMNISDENNDFIYADLGPKNNRIVSSPIPITTTTKIRRFRKSLPELKECVDLNLQKLKKLLSPKIINLDDMNIQPEDEEEYFEDEEEVNLEEEILGITGHRIVNEEIEFQCDYIKNDDSLSKWVNASQLDELEYLDIITEYRDSFVQIPDELVIYFDS